MKRANVRAFTTGVALLLAAACGGGEDPPIDPAGAVDPAAPASDPPAEAPTWQVIPPELVEAMAWPTFVPLAVWPDPESLTPVDELPGADRPDEADVRRLLEDVSLVYHDPAAGPAPEEPPLAEAKLPEGGVLAVDDRGRLFLMLPTENGPALASMQMYRDSPRPLTALAMVFRTGEPDAATLDEVRDRVGRYVIPALADELETGEDPLRAHPRFEFAGNGHLSPSGPAALGVYFQWIHAYARDGYVMFVLY